MTEKEEKPPLGEKDDALVAFPRRCLPSVSEIDVIRAETLFESWCDYWSPRLHRLVDESELCEGFADWPKLVRFGHSDLPAILAMWFVIGSYMDYWPAVYLYDAVMWNRPGCYWGYDNPRIPDGDLLVGHTGHAILTAFRFSKLKFCPSCWTIQPPISPWCAECGTVLSEPGEAFDFFAHALKGIPLPDTTASLYGQRIEDDLSEEQDIEENNWNVQKGKTSRVLLEELEDK